MRRSVIIGRALWIPVDVVWGAIFFWTPDMLVHAVAPSYAPAIGLFLFSWFLPLVALIGLEVMWHRRREGGNRALIALAMGFGIWLFGPLCTLLDASRSGGTIDAKTVAVLTAMAPLSMIDLATYDGTLLALPLATIVLLFSTAKEWNLAAWVRLIQR